MRLRHAWTGRAGLTGRLSSSPSRHRGGQSPPQYGASRLCPGLRPEPVTAPHFNHNVIRTPLQYAELPGGPSPCETPGAQRLRARSKAGRHPRSRPGQTPLASPRAGGVWRGDPRAQYFQHLLSPPARPREAPRSPAPARPRLQPTAEAHLTALCRRAVSAGARKAAAAAPPAAPGASRGEGGAGGRAGGRKCGAGRGGSLAGSGAERAGSVFT